MLDKWLNLHACLSLKTLEPLQSNKPLIVLVHITIVLNFRFSEPVYKKILPFSVQIKRKLPVTIWKKMWYSKTVLFDIVKNGTELAKLQLNMKFFLRDGLLLLLSLLFVWNMNPNYGSAAVLLVSHWKTNAFVQMELFMRLVLSMQTIQRAEFRHCQTALT